MMQGKIYDIKEFNPHGWMRFVESSNTEVSGAFEVSQSRGKYFLGNPAAVFLLKK